MRTLFYLLFPETHTFFSTQQVKYYLINHQKHSIRNILLVQHHFHRVNLLPGTYENFIRISEVFFFSFSNRAFLTPGLGDYKIAQKWYLTISSHEISFPSWWAHCQKLKYAFALLATNKPFVGENLKTHICIYFHMINWEHFQVMGVVTVESYLCNRWLDFHHCRVISSQQMTWFRIPAGWWFFRSLSETTHFSWGKMRSSLNVSKKSSGRFRINQSRLEISL